MKTLLLPLPLCCVGWNFAGAQSQIPQYDPPPPAQYAPGNNGVEPNTQPLTEKQITDVRALFESIKSGNGGASAMGELVFLGRPVVPLLIEGLQNESTYVKMTVMNVMQQLKDPRTVEPLVELAKKAEEETKVRTLAFQTAVKIRPEAALPALEALASSAEFSGLRTTAAVEAKKIRAKETVPVLIKLLEDEEKVVAVTAISSLGVLTKFGDGHNWGDCYDDTFEDRIRAEDEAREKNWNLNQRCQALRKRWAKGWIDWWADANKNGAYEFPQPNSPHDDLPVQPEPS